MAKRAQGLPELELMFSHTVESEPESCSGQAEGALDHSDVDLRWQTLDALGLQRRIQLQLPKHLQQLVCCAPAFRSDSRELSLPQVLPVCKPVEEKPTHAFAGGHARVRLVQSPFLIALMASPAAPEESEREQTAAAMSLGLGLDRWWEAHAAEYLAAQSESRVFAEDLVAAELQV